MKNKETGSTFKALAVIGFAAIIIIVAWLSIQLVNILPNAFSSLASLREAINQQSAIIVSETQAPDALSVTSDSNIVSTNEMVTLTWDTAQVKGTYTFSFSCEEGVSMSIIEDIAGQRAISCDTNYNIGNVDSLTLEVASEKNRFANVDYKISFLATNDTEPRAAGDSSFTIVNSTIPDISLVDNTETVESETEVTTPPANTRPTTPVTPVYEQEFIYTIPVSDPNGKTDLATRYLFAGNISGNRFVPGAIEQNDSGAIQFEVKNIGTKTSDTWTYSMTLPNGGEFSSTKQSALKPNERAVITLGFPTASEDDFSFRVTIDEDNDRNSSNDKFTQKVNFVD
jgi:hypothetical protein